MPSENRTLWTNKTLIQSNQTQIFLLETGVQVMELLY